MPEFHFYEPAKGHGLPHDPFRAIRAYLKEGLFDLLATHPIQRAGYSADYTGATAAFTMKRPW